MDTKQIAIAAIEHSIFCDSEILTEYFDDPNDYFQKTFGCTVKEAEEALGCKFNFGEAWETATYKCKICGQEIRFSADEFDCGGSYHPDGEELLWEHIQMNHEDKFEEVQDWETPFMIEECYEEVV